MGGNLEQGDSVQDIIHAHIHNGHFFSCDAYTASLPNNDFLDLLITTGPNPVHFRHITRSAGDSLLNVYEDSGWFIGSPEINLNVINRNRVVAAKKTSDTTIIQNPAQGSPDGVKIAGPIFIPGGHGGNSPGHESEGFGEFILKPNTVYLFQVQNISGVAENISVQADFYE
jgi:hypothetical protein